MHATRECVYWLPRRIRKCIESHRVLFVYAQCASLYERVNECVSAAREKKTMLTDDVSRKFVQQHADDDDDDGGTTHAH